MKEDANYICQQNPKPPALTLLSNCFLKDERWIMLLFSLFLLVDWWVGWPI